MPTIKVVDKDTGEILAFDWHNDDDLANIYTEVQQRIKAFERAKDKVSEIIKDRMGDDERMQTSKGIFKRIHAEYWSYDPEIVAEVFEEDAVRFMKVDKKKLDLELAEHAEDGGQWPQASQRLRDGMRLDRVVNSLRLEIE